MSGSKVTKLTGKRYFKLSSLLEQIKHLWKFLRDRLGKSKEPTKHYLNHLHLNAGSALKHPEKTPSSERSEPLFTLSRGEHKAFSPPSLHRQSALVHPETIEGETYIETRLQHMMTALTQQNTTKFLTEGYHLLQQLALESARNEKNLGGDGLYSELQTRLEVMVKDPQMKQALAENADYLNQLSNVIAALPKQKMQTGERADNHISASAIGTQSTFDYILTACHNQAFPEQPYTESDPPVDMVQKYFDVLTRCRTPMEVAIEDLSRVLLVETDTSAIRESFANLCSASEAYLRSIGEKVADASLIEQAQGQLMEVNLPGKEIIQLSADYLNPNSVLFHNMKAAMVTEARSGGVPERFMLACHEAMTKKLGIYDQVQELIK